MCGAVALALAAGAAGVSQVATPHPARMVSVAAVTAPVAAPAPQALAAPSSYKLKLKGQYQQTDYYCVPASGSMSLSTFGITASQATLAEKMKTTEDGTSGTNATPVLNDYVEPSGYKYTVVTDVVGDGATLMDRVSYDVGTLHRAPTISVWRQKLPWNKGKVSGTKVGHAMVAYGYDKAKGAITVFDPWKATGGTHTISATTLAGVLQESGSMRYISKL